MSPPRTPHGQALTDLVDRLGRYAELPIDPDLRAHIAFAEIASTPGLSPLDDLLYELLLATIGFDLNDADHLHAAVWTTALLIAGDPSLEGLYCGHDDHPSHLCALIRDTDLDDLYCQVEHLADQGLFDVIYDQRRTRNAQYGIFDDPGRDQAA